MFLLDANVVSELRKAGDGRIDARVAAWIAAEDAASFFISAPTLMELEIGILRIERRDAEQGARLRRWMDGRVLPGFEARILPVDSAVALTCARLRVPDPRADRRHGHRARDDGHHGKHRRLRGDRRPARKPLGRQTVEGRRFSRTGLRPDVPVEKFERFCAVSFLVMPGLVPGISLGAGAPGRPRICRCL